MNRIDKLFADYHQYGRKALVMYVTAGDPSLEFSERLIETIIGAGADIIEIGVPFSDPMADGPTIQAASQRALKGKVTIERILEMTQRLRRKFPDIPFVLFSYYNVLMQYGVERLAEDSSTAGIDGWLVVDMSNEEQDEILPALKKCGIERITLLAPTTGRERMQELLHDAQGFVYYITVTGVTGARTTLPPNLAEQLQDVVNLSDIPVVAGFGVSSPDMARAVSDKVDGVVVGSKLVQTVADAPDSETALRNAESLVHELAEALH
ncbi:MAG: tryptophan synthase subunit alpha [Lentisphaeria bacterium]